MTAKILLACQTEWHKTERFGKTVHIEYEADNVVLTSVTKNRVFTTTKVSIHCNMIIYIILTFKINCLFG